MVLCCSRSCRALTRKNVILQSRSPLASLCQIMLPLAFILAMMGLSFLFSTTVTPATSYAGEATAIPPLGVLPGLLAKRQQLLAVVVDGGADAQQFADDWLADALSLYPGLNGSTFGDGAGFATPVLRSLYIPPLASVIKRFDSSRQLYDYVNGGDYSGPDVPSIYAAIEFQSGPPSYQYRIRLNASDLPSTTTAPVNTYSSAYFPTWVQRYLYGNIAKPAPGFLSLQLAVDRFILGKRSVPPTSLDPMAAVTTFAKQLAFLSPAAVAALPAELAALATSSPARAAAMQLDVQQWLTSETRAPQQVDVAAFPVSAYTSNVFYTQVLYSLTLLFVIALVYPVIRLVRGLVMEKELKLRESLLMMGASHWSLWNAWIATYILIFAILCGLITAIGRRVFPASDPGIIFLLFFLFCFASTNYGLLMSVFFTKSRVAATTSGLLYVASYFPFFALSADSPTNVKTAACLLAPTCLGTAIDVLASLEQNQIGATATTARSTVVNRWTLASTLGMLLLDSVLYWVLAWYLDQVLPTWARGTGVPRPWYFPLTPSYWQEACGCRASADDVRKRKEAQGRSRLVQGPSSWGLLRRLLGRKRKPVGTAAAAADGAALSPSAPAPFIQELDATLQAKAAAGRCLEVEGLRKEFSTPDGVKVAVDGLDLTFFEGQITCLLGHNGAGKTTTISILTGLIPPTEGRASLFGSDVFANQEALRRDFGVCPQHDVLWPELTVNEHLRLFGAIKGVPSSDLASEGAKALAMVGLTEKAAAQVGTLSGGQKRKLSLCLAFLGGSKVVFLDEPTSGVDPLSRRSMWSMLQAARQGRIIVLTTHFMDEADVLGDRIAIMAEGRLRCVGTPLALKQALGIGYTATVVKAPSASDDAIVAAVKSHVSEATLFNAAGAELSLRLPLTSLEALPRLLRDLDDRSTELGVSNVGMTVTSLEDVFLRVATGEHITSSSSAAAHGHHPDAPGKQLLADATLQSSDSAGTPASSATSDGAVPPTKSVESVRSLALVQPTGFPLFWRHLKAMVVKRSCYARRDIRAVGCLLLVPLITLIVGISLIAASINTDPPPYTLSTSQFNAAAATGFNRRTGAGTGTSRLPNYVPSFTFKAGAPGDAPGIADIMGAIPVGWASTDSGALLISSASAADIQDAYGFINASDPAPIAAYARMSAFLLDNKDAYAASKYGAFVFTRGGSLVTSGQGAGTTLVDDNVTTVGILHNTTALHGAPVFLNVLSNALLRRLAGITDSSATTVDGPTIETVNAPLPWTAYQRANRLAGQGFGVVQVILITMCYVPAAFAAFVVREREVNAKHQQTLSGVSLPAYWVASWLFDCATYLIPWALTLIIISGFNIGDLMSAQGDKVTGVALLLFLYGGAGTSFVYMLSHLFKSPSGAQAAVSMVNIVIFGGVIASFVLRLVPSSCYAYQPMRWGLMPFLPIYALGEGLSNIASMSLLPSLQRMCDVQNGITKPNSAYPPYASALHNDIAGASMGFLVAQMVVYFVATLLIDIARSDMAVQDALRRWFGWALCCCGQRRSGSSTTKPHLPAVSADLAAATTDVTAANSVDPDVAEEDRRMKDQLQRIASSSSSSGGGLDLEDGNSNGAPNDVIAVHRLRREFGPKVAVDDVSFGVPAGEVFGFLGVNGAGKSTTLNMLTGVLLPTSGRARLAGYDIIHEQPHVRRLLGYCPQFDALLDLLSVREHLYMYARIKGLPEPEVPAIVERALVDFDIAPHADKLAGQLSGGNKRKLSMAVALIGNPPIVILDEASTGVDPLARRKLWRIISRVATQQRLCSIILTTHSMEEAEALSTRIGIMVGGRLRALGTTQHLRSTHGSGYSAELRLDEPPASLVDAIRATVHHTLTVQGGGGGGAEGSSLAPGVLPQVCAALGRPDRASALTAPGSPLRDAHASGAGIPLALFCAWWAEEDGVDAVLRDMTSSFPGCSLLERQGSTLKFKIPASLPDDNRSSTTLSPARSLATQYDKLVALRSRQPLAACTLSQTTLEEVFNRLAAEGTRDHALHH